MKYQVAVSCTLLMEAEDQADAVGKIRYMNLFDETVRNLAVKVLRTINPLPAPSPIANEPTIATADDTAKEAL